MSADADRQPDDRPDPSTLPCDECGHVWFPGERRHVYLAEDAERPEEAAVLCTLCRRQRGLGPPEPDPAGRLGSWSQWS